jgi:hypothetical protein
MRITGTQFGAADSILDNLIAEKQNRPDDRRDAEWSRIERAPGRPVSAGVEADGEDLGARGGAAPPQAGRGAVGADQPRAGQPGADGRGGGMGVEFTAYAAFERELIGDLIPYIESHYSVQADREHPRSRRFLSMGGASR